MSLEAIIAGTLPLVVVSLLGFWFSKIQREGDKVDAELNRRLTNLESAAGEHMKRDALEHRDLDVRVSQAETAAKGHRDEVDSVRGLIEDGFRTMNTRIDGLYSRSGSPVPRRR